MNECDMNEGGATSSPPLEKGRSDGEAVRVGIKAARFDGMESNAARLSPL